MIYTSAVCAYLSQAATPVLSIPAGKQLLYFARVVAFFVSKLPRKLD